ncbi:MAG: hypothetical protein J6N52_02975 [Clostridia bacterium]|nr:hypothetical protein [Clostridia bacterium]
MKKQFGMVAAISMLAGCMIPGTVVFAATDTVQADADALTVEDILTVPIGSNGYLIDNLDLDIVTKGEINESPITWSSSNADVISTAGIITRPTETTDVTLTATIGTDSDTVTKDFNFTVPAKGVSVNGMPVVGDKIYEDTFSDGEISDKIILLGKADNDILEEKEGKFLIDTKTWGSGKEPGIKIVAQSNENCVYEYTMDLGIGVSGEACHYVRNCIDYYSVDGHPNWKNETPYYLEWSGASDPDKKNNPITLKGVSEKYYKVSGGKLKVTVYFDFANKQYSMWLNNEIAFENIPFRSGSYGQAKMVEALKIFTVTAGSFNGRGPIYVDNFKAYKASKSDLFVDAEGIENDILTGETVTNADGTKYLMDNLSFEKTEGSNGSTISYEVSNPSVIDENGVVTRDVVDRAVTVTATVKDATGSELVKTFDYIVPGKYHAVSVGDLPAKGENLTAGTVTKKGDTYITEWSAEGDRISFTSEEGKGEPGFNYKYSSPLTGKFIQRVSFKSTSDGLRLRISDSKYNRFLTIYKSKNELGLEVDGYKNKYTINGSEVQELDLLFDFTGETPSITPYLNGTMQGDSITVNVPNRNLMYIATEHMCGTTMMGYQWGPGTTEIYSLAANKVIDASSYPEFMKGDAVFSNAGTPVKGSNKVTVPIIKTTAGEQTAMVFYAIYSADGTLKGVSLEPVTLSNASHQEYEVEIILDSVSGGETHKVFIWNGDIVPLSAEPFPA